jgi:hypothetical protein
LRPVWVHQPVWELLLWWALRRRWAAVRLPVLRQQQVVRVPLLA